MKIIEVNQLRCDLGGTKILDNVTFDVEKGEIFAIVGGSGSGKTTILRNLIMLIKPTSGEIKIFGNNIWASSSEVASQLRQRFGVMFQHSALFSSLTVLENVMFPLREFTSLSLKDCRALAYLKIAFVGLPGSSAHKLPGELSGGMQKRAALARAIVLDPELLFLDEHTSGLDPQGAEELDALISSLRDALDLTIVMVTHDLDSLWAIADKVAFIGEGTIIASQPMQQLIKNSHPIIQTYFSSNRAHRRNL
jgi:phospholipid/cholesterol/gamma-HCH transport system ATP-binding protein